MMSEIYRTSRYKLNDASVDDIDLRYEDNGIASNTTVDNLDLGYEHNDVVANTADELYLSFRTQIGAMVLQGVVGSALSDKKVYDYVMITIGSAIRDKNLIKYFEIIYNHDKCTFDHSIRVAIFTLILTTRLNLTDDDKRQIIVSALLHDIGKVKITHDILSKPSKLSESEMKSIQHHTTYGYDILKDDTTFTEAILLGVKHHHERYDGRGYPSQFEDKDTHIYAKLISVADIYDAVTSRRAYKNGTTLIYSIRYLESLSNTALSTDIVDNFITSIGVFTVGTTLLLDSDEVAVIFENSQNKSFMPRVKVITDSNYKLLDEPFFVDLNIKDKNGNYLKSVKKIIRKEHLFKYLLK